MRWPLVSRAAHDREIAEFRADIARALDARDQERADRLEDQARADQRYDALLEKYSAVVMERAADAAAKSKLTEALRDEARQPDGRIDPRLLNHLRGEANQLLRDGKSVDDVIEAIGQWQTTETGDDRLTADAMVRRFSDTEL